MIRRNATHGQRRTPEYKAWCNMKVRCNNPRGFGYENYGGRGIKVCDRWSASFQAFLDDMGRRPSANHSLDRVDVNGDYEPANCKWSTRHEQMANTTRNRFVVVGGQRIIVAEAARRLGVTVNTVRQRMRMGELHGD